MNVRRHDRPTSIMLAALAIAIAAGLTACGSSSAEGDATVPITVASGPSTPVTTHTTDVPISGTDAHAGADSEALVVTGEEVAELERQLDEIDQLLAGVEADLSQD